MFSFLVTAWKSYPVKYAGDKRIDCPHTNSPYNFTLDVQWRYWPDIPAAYFVLLFPPLMRGKHSYLAS